MLWILWILGVLILLVTVFMALPLVLEIDTEREIFLAKWQGIFAVRAIPGADGWRFFFKIFFFEKEWFPKMGTPSPPKISPKKPVRKKAGSPFSLRKMAQLAKNLFRAVNLKRLKIDWDTGDFVKNAWLFPVFHGLSGGKRQLTINFFGKQAFAILLQTRLGLLAWAVLKVFFQPKFLKK